MKKITCLLTALILCLAITGCTATSNEKDQSSASETKQEQSQESEASKEQKVFGINDPASNKKTELTVTNVERSAGGEYDKPKEGMEYVIVTVKYKNVSDKETISYNPLDFKIKNSQGQIESISFTAINVDTALSSGDLAPGGEVEGTIAFEQPVGDAGLVLQYFDNILSDTSSAEFNLQ